MKNCDLEAGDELNISSKVKKRRSQSLQNINKELTALATAQEMNEEKDATDAERKDGNMDLREDDDNADVEGATDDDDSVDTADLTKALHKSSSGPPALVAVPTVLPTSKESILRKHGTMRQKTPMPPSCLAKGTKPRI